MLRLGILFILALAAAPTHAADPWSDADIAREAVYLTLHAADWRQTRVAAERPDRFVETNPILGEYPSARRIDGYFAATALLHVGVVHVLPASWRPAFQYFWIGVEAGQAVRNYRVGVRMDF